MDTQQTSPVDPSEEDQFLTFDDWNAKNAPADPLDRYRGYGEYYRKEMLRRGEYDDEEAKAVDGKLYQKAVADGVLVGEDPEEESKALFSPKLDADQDLHALNRYAIEQGNKELSNAASRYKALLDPTIRQGFQSDEEYNKALDAARIDLESNGGTDAAFSDAKRAAVARGDLPFAMIDGRIEIADGVPYDDAGLATVLAANPKLDARLVGEVKRKLTPIEGYEASLNDFEKQELFAKAVMEADKANPELKILDGLNRARHDLDLTNTSLGPLDADDLGVSVDQDRVIDPVVMALKSIGLDKQFGGKVKDFALDMAKKAISPEINRENPAASLQKLSTGEYVAPTNLLLNKPLLDKALESVPEQQRGAILKSRDTQIEGQAQAIKKVLLASDAKAFMKSYDVGKTEGLSDVEIIDRFMSDPANEHNLATRLKGVGASLVSSVVDTVAAIPALAGNETALRVIQQGQKDDARRREYVNLFGGKLGFGYDVATQIAPLAVDLLATKGAATAIKSAGGAVGSGLRGAVKAGVRSALSSESENLITKFINKSAANTAAREGVGSVGSNLDEVVSAVGRDFSRKLNLGTVAAAQFATAFNRSAGSTYASLYSALEQEKNADGSAKYTPKQIREIALPHAAVSGVVEGTVGSVLTGLGLAGAERVITGDLSRKQIGTIFNQVRKNWKALPASAREGIDMASGEKMLESVIRKGVTSYAKMAGEEAGEESITEALQYVNEQIAQDKPINLGDLARQSVYAGMIGGALGGGVNVAVDTFSSGNVPEATADAVRRSAFLQTAKKLEATSPRTAEVFRKAAETGSFAPSNDGQVTDIGRADAPAVDFTAERQAVSDELTQLTAGRRRSELSADELTRVDQLQKTKSEIERVAPPAEADAAPVAGPTISTDEISRIASLPEAERRVAAAKVATELSDHFDPADLPDALAPNELSPERAVLDDIRSIYGSTQAGKAEQVKAERVAALDGNALAESVKAGNFAEPEHKALAEILAANPSEQFDPSVLGDYSAHESYAKAVSEAAGPRNPSSRPNRITVPAAETPGVAPEGLKLDDIATYDPALPEQIMASADPAASAEAVRSIIASRTRNAPEINGAELVQPWAVDVLSSAVHGSDAAPVVLAHREVAAAIDSDPNTRAAFEQYAAERGVQNVEGMTSNTLARAFRVAIAADASIRQAHDERVAQANVFPQADNELAEAARSFSPNPKAVETKRLAELNKHDFGKGVQAFLNSVLKNGQQPHRSAAKALLKIPNFAANAQVSLARIPNAGWAGVHIPETGEVVINLSQDVKRGAVDTVIHELLHAATTQAIHNPNQQQARVVGRLQKIRESLIARGVNNYATSNLDEFVTHFFTDADFQRQVEDATKKSEKSVVRVIIDAIREMLNLGTGSETITSDVMNDMLSLLKTEGDPYGMSAMKVQQLEAGNKGEASAQQQPTDEILPYVEPEPDPEPSEASKLVSSLAPDMAVESADLGGIPLRIDINNPGAVMIDEEAMEHHLDGVNDEHKPMVVGNMLDREQSHHDGMAQFQPADDEYFRSVSTSVLNGNGLPDTSEDARSYLSKFIESLWNRVSGKKNDPFVYADVNRAATALQQVGASDEEIGAMFQLSDAESDSFYDALGYADNRPISRPLTPRQQAKYDRKIEAGDTIGAENYKNMIQTGRMVPWYNRLFVRRDDLPIDISQQALDKRQILGVIDATAKRLGSIEKGRVMRAENTPIELLNDAVGTDKAFMTKEQDAAQREAFDSRMNAISDRKREMVMDRNKAEKELKEVSAELRGVLSRKDQEANAEISAKLSQKIGDLTIQIESLSSNIESLTAKENETLDWDHNVRRDLRLKNIAEARLRQSQALEVLSQHYPKSHEWAVKMRNAIDVLQEKTAQQIEAQDPATAQMIRETIGVYLNRSYQAFKNKDWAKVLFDDPQYTEALNAGRKWMRDKLAVERANANRELPEFRDTAYADLVAEAKEHYESDAGSQEVDHAIQDMLKSMKSGPNIKASSSEIRTDAGPFMFKDFALPEELQGLLGKVEEPAAIAENTLHKMAGIYANKRMLNEMVRIGREQGYMVTKAEFDANPRNYPGWTHIVTKNENNAYYSALSGMYAPEDVAKAFQASFVTSSQGEINAAQTVMEKINRKLYGLAGLGLGVATLGSTGYYVRNLAGGVIMLAHSGINPFSLRTTKSLKVAFDAAFGVESDHEAFIQELTSLGIWDDAASIGYLREIVNRYNGDPVGIMDHLEKLVDERNKTVAGYVKAGRKAGSELVGKLASLAEMTESFPKIAAYLYEKQILKESGMQDEQQIRQEAASKVRQSFATKSEASQMVSAFTHSGLGAVLAPFLRFKTEMFRITVGNMRLAVQEMESDNPVIRRRGQQRGFGAMTILMGVSFSLPALMKMAAGIGDDEEESIRSAMPSYSKNSTFFYERQDDGKIRVWDFTFTNPFSFVMDPFSRSLDKLKSNNAGEIPAVWGRFFGEEFMGENIVAGKVLDLARNVDESTGKKIHLETDSYGEKLYKSAEHVIGGSYTPAFVKKLNEMNRARFATDPKADSPAAVAGYMFSPTKPRSFAIEDLARRSFWNSKQAFNDLRQIDGQIGSKLPMSPEDRAALYIERNKAKEKVFSELANNAQGFISLGGSPDQIRNEMVGVGFSRKSVGLAANGLWERQTYTPDVWAKILKNAGEDGYEAVKAAHDSMPHFNQVPGVAGKAKIQVGGEEEESD